ncbi:MAG TPA: response regulator, partial [Kofleriaceae bacterium]|nr:response regulator [Kofleriaceae bacterium]
MSSHVVLVVEDNPITRKVVRLALGHEGFVVTEATCADEALTSVATAAPDLVLQDLLLADIDGIDLVRQLRALPHMAAVPIIAFSGFLSRLDGRVTACGFTDVLAKPTEPSRLVEVVRKHLPHAAKRDLETPRGRRVLIVDDDPLQLKATSLRLKRLGFEVVTAVDGLTALQVLRSSAIDVVLSDVLMPRIDGFQLCAEIRQDPTLARIPVILASSNYVEDADRVLAEEMGASAFVVREPDLEAVIAELTPSISRPGRPAVDVAPNPAAHHMRVTRQLERQTALNTRSAQKSSLQASILSVVAGISEVLSRNHSLDESLPDVLSSLLDASGVSCGALFLSPPPDGHLALATTLGFDEHSVVELARFCDHRDFFDRVIASRMPHAIRTTGDDLDASDLLARIHVDAAIVIPFVGGDERLGLVLLASQRVDLSDNEWIAFGRTIAVQVGQALSLARAFGLLSASERRCQTLIERASDSIVILDLEGRIEDVNPEGRRFLGVTSEQLIGRSVFDLIEPTGRQRAKDNFNGLVE